MRKKMKKKHNVLEMVYEITILWQKSQENADGIWFNICIWAVYLSASDKWKLNSIMVTPVPNYFFNSEKSRKVLAISTWIW